MEYEVLETKGVKLKNFFEKSILNHNTNDRVYVFNKKILYYLINNKNCDFPLFSNIGLKLNKKYLFIQFMIHG